MKTNQFNGKAIYQPKGKAAEYSEWACNFYVGCSNGCEYCYLKKGRGAAILGGDKPTLKKCFRDEHHALKVFESELSFNIVELQKHGLFFSFTTDPCLLETFGLTAAAGKIAIRNHVPIKILTKSNLVIITNIVLRMFGVWEKPEFKKYISIGFSLTGHDELEPGAITNAGRIKAMRKLHDAGFKTFASIEPVINFADSLSMIEQAAPYCDLFKIGLKSGDKHHYELVRAFMEDVLEVEPTRKIYCKDSLLKQAGIDRDSILMSENIVSKDYNLFTF